MRMNDLYGQFSKASRNYEIPMRNAEDALTQAQREELEFRREIAACLQNIAAIQIDENPALDADVRRQIELRSEEEQAIRQALASAEAEIEHLTAKSSALAGQVEGLEKSLAETLSADETYRQILRELTAAGQEESERAEQYKEICDEVKRKAPAFQSNELMTYLVRIGYGTETYTRRGLFRYLDRWIASLCNYDANRPNQIMLADMGGANEELRGRFTSVLPDLKRRLQARHEDLEAQQGLRPVRTELNSINAFIATKKARANSLQDDLSTYRMKKDKRYRQATDTLAAILNNESADELVARVRQTPSGQDDNALSNLVDLQRKIEAARARMIQLKSEHERTSAQYQRAKDIERQIRGDAAVTKDYEYRGVNVDALVTGYVLGTLNQSDVLNDVREHQSRIPKVEYETPSSSMGWPSPNYGGSAGSSPARKQESSPSRESDDSPSVFSTTDSAGGDTYSTTDSF